MLTERQKHILRVIVDDYIRSAEPVGSRSISKHPSINFSPATIRNDMSDLEEMGYLDQPHTSAGRIPSNKGYRFYVDHLMIPRKLSTKDIERIKVLFAEQFVEAEQVIQQTALALSELTSYTAIVLGTQMFNTTLKHLQLIPLSSKTAVVIIVTNTGYVENKKIVLPEGTSIEIMERLIRLLNEKLVGVPLFQLRSRMYTEISLELEKHFEHYQQMMHILDQTLGGDKEEKIYLGGTANIFSQPEFRDVDKVRDLLELLEQHERIQDILSVNKAQSGIQVKIGQELSDEAINNCSIITATYSIEGRPVGTLSILGPTRMHYPKVIGILDYLAHDLNEILDHLYGKDS